MNKTQMPGSKQQQFDLVMQAISVGIKDKSLTAQQGESLADQLMGGEANKLVTYIASTGKSYKEVMDNAVIDISVQDSNQSGGGTIIVSYRDADDGNRIKTLTVGSGEPVTHSPNAQKDVHEARIIAGGCSAHSKKKQAGMSLTLPAVPELMEMTAEGKIATSGFGNVEDREWKIAQLQCQLTEQGFSFNLVLE